jgi:hypothetical protein
MQTEKTGKIERFPGLKGREETRKTEMEQRNVEGRACVAQREKVESKASLGFCAASSNRMYTLRWAVLTESGCALAPFDIRVRCYKTWRHEVESTCVGSSTKLQHGSDASNGGSKLQHVAPVLFFFQRVSVIHA